MPPRPCGDEADAVVASRLVVPGVSAALAAAACARRLDDAQVDVARGTWHWYLPALRLIELTPEVAASAADLAGELVLGGADAVHLASALVLDGGQPVLAAWDRGCGCWPARWACVSHRRRSDQRVVGYAGDHARCPGAGANVCRSAGTARVRLKCSQSGGSGGRQGGDRVERACAARRELLT